MRVTERRLKDMEESLGELKKQALSIYESFSPLFFFQPFDMLLNKFDAQYYAHGIPSGLTTRFEKAQLRTIADFIQTLSPDTRIMVSYGRCSEWLYVFTLYGEQSELYSAEQLERFKTDFLRDWRWCHFLETELGKELKDALTTTPQSFTLTAKEFNEYITTKMKREG